MTRDVLALLAIGVVLAGCTESHAADGDGGPLDGGGSDGGGGLACDAGPIDLCRAATGSPGCCGDPIAPLCAIGGGLTCPGGAIRTADCTGFVRDGTCTMPPLECVAATDCTLLPQSCCGSCGAPTPGDMVAVPNDRVDEQRAAACGEGAVCPGCFMEPDPFLLATCDAGRCQAIDLHADDLTLCTSDADCQLAPRVCCGCGVLGAREVIAFNPERGSYGELVCDPRADCPPCVPTYEGVEAGCDAGRCVVRVSAP